MNWPESGQESMLCDAFHMKTLIRRHVIITIIIIILKMLQQHPQLQQNYNQSTTNIRIVIKKNKNI
jgi:hypothetical protein